MPALMPRATPIHDSARLRVLEAYIETLKTENEILKSARRSDQVLGAVAGAVL